MECRLSPRYSRTELTFIWPEFGDIMRQFTEYSLGSGTSESIFEKKYYDTMTGREKEATIKKLHLHKTNNEQPLRTPLYSIIIEAADIFLGKNKYKTDDRLLRIIYLNR